MSGFVGLTGKIKQKTVTPDNPGFFMVEAGDIEGGIGIRVNSTAERDAIPKYQRPNITYVMIDDKVYKYEMVFQVDEDIYSDAHWSLKGNWINIETDNVFFNNYIVDSKFTSVGQANPAWSIINVGGNPISLSVENGYLVNDRTTGLGIIGAYINKSKIKQGVDYLFAINSKNTSGSLESVSYTISAIVTLGGSTVQPTYLSDNSNKRINANSEITHLFRFRFDSDISSIIGININIYGFTSSVRFINPLVMEASKENILYLPFLESQSIEPTWTFEDVLTLENGLEVGGAPINLNNVNLNINDSRIVTDRYPHSFSNNRYLIEDNLSKDGSYNIIGGLYKLRSDDTVNSFFLNDIEFNDTVYVENIGSGYMFREHRIENSGLGALWYNLYEYRDFVNDYDSSAGDEDFSILTSGFVGDDSNGRELPDDGMIEAWRTDVDGDNVNNASPIHYAIYANGYNRIAVRDSFPSNNKRHVDGTIGFAKHNGNTVLGVKINTTENGINDDRWKRVLTEFDGVEKADIIHEPLVDHISNTNITFAGKVEQSQNINNTSLSGNSTVTGINTTDVPVKNTMTIIRVATTNAGASTDITLSDFKETKFGIDQELYMKDTSGWDSLNSVLTITANNNNQVDYIIIRSVVLDDDIVDGYPTVVRHELTIDSEYFKV